MHLTKLASPLVLALALAAGSASPAAAQSAITATDIQRLQDTVFDASRHVNQIRTWDGATAAQLQAELDDVFDETIYMKVKVRKHEPVSRRDFAGVRDRAENISNRAREESGGWVPSDDRPVSTGGNPGRDQYPTAGRYPNDSRYPTDGRYPTDSRSTNPGDNRYPNDSRSTNPSDNRYPNDSRSTNPNDNRYPNDNRGSYPGEPNTVRSQNPNEIPVGTEFDVRLQNPLSSKTAQVEERFEATTMVDLRDERGRVMVPAGSLMRGIVSSVHPATRMERKGSMTVAFDRATINGRSYPIRATVSQALESEGIMGEKEKIGIGAGAGAIIGAILGGAKGALAGILIGGGGTIAATEGKDVELPSGTVLRVRMDAPLTLR